MSIAYSGCQVTIGELRFTSWSFIMLLFIWLQGLFLVLSMSRKRRAPASFEWQTVPESADEPLP
jgi:hypothetical protein